MVRISLVGALFVSTVSPAFCAAILEKETSTPATVGVPYTFYVEFENTDYTNTCLNLTWTMVPPGVQLTPGLTLSCDVGYFYQPGQPKPVYPETASSELDWTPAAAGVFHAQIQVTNNTNTYSALFNFTITVQAAPPPPQPLDITSAGPFNAMVNKPYTVTFIASGGTPGYSWSFSGDLPIFLVGIGIGASFTFSGTPTEVPSGPYLFTVTVKDSAGAIVNTQFSLAVASDALTITTGSPLPDAPLNQAYGPFQFAATGGTPAYSWQLAPGSGPLPHGLTLNTNGSLTGITSGISAGTLFQFTVQVTDSKGQKAVKTFQLTVAPPIPRDITLLDPVPLANTPPLWSPSARLLDGSHVSTDPNVLASSYARTVQGIAADGFSQIVIKIPTGQPGQKVKINLVGDQSCSSAGSGWLGGLALPTDITGLNSLAATQLSVQAVSVAVGNQSFAFAIYVSPVDFDCTAPDPNASTSPAKERLVTLQITADGNSYTNPQIQIVRPPVLLVHGLNDDASAWDQVEPVLDLPGAFQVYRADYSDSISVTSVEPLTPFPTIKGSALGFTYNAPIVLQQLKNYLNTFRLGMFGGSATNPIGVPVAAVQMDLVGHSMGGLVSRAMTDLGDYYAPETLNGGYIHKLITVGTPHLGSPYAQEMVKPLNWCPRILKGFQGDRFVFQATTSNGQVIDGAMKELQQITDINDTSNAALYQLNHGPVLRLLPTAMIAGVMPAVQVAAITTSAAAAFLREVCNTSSLAQFLTVGAYPLLMGSTQTDGLVTQASAFDGLERSEVFPAAHSFNTTFLFPGLYLLEQTSSVPTRIEQLLLTPTSSTAYVSLPQQ